MKITYQTSTDFYDGISACVERGLTFTADFHAYTITLTGGY